MNKYLLVFRLAFLDILEYRADYLLRMFRYMIMLVFVMFLWIAVAKEGHLLAITIESLVVYYVFALILYGLSNYHLDYVEQDIHLGAISKFMLKPMSPFWYYFSFEAATALGDVVIKTITLVPLALFLGFSWDVSMAALLWYVLFLPLIFYTTFSMFFMLSTLGFWLVQVDAVRMSVLFFSRYVSGIIIPFVFFPDWLQAWLFYSPFPHFAYYPIQLIKGDLSLNTALSSFLVLSIWAGIFTLGRVWIWKRATYSYESTGI